jgi:hypothetical protein
MATGTLGQALLAANTNTTVYTVPAATTATINISVMNQNADTPAVFDLAVSASGTPSASEYVFKSIVLESGAALEKTGLVVSQNKLLVVKSSAANVSVNVYGYEV